MPRPRAAIIVPRASKEGIPARDIQGVVHAIKERIEALETEKSGKQDIVTLRRTVAALEQNVQQATQGGDEPVPIESVDVAANVDIEVTAGTADVRASRVVAITADGFVHADQTDLAQAQRVMGFAMGHAQSGAAFFLRVAGVVRNRDWDWTSGEMLYLDTDGLVTNAPAGGAFRQVVGFALSDKRVLIAIPHPYELDSSPAGAFLTRDGDVPRQAQAVETATPDAIARTRTDGTFDPSLIPPGEIRAPAGAALNAYQAATTTSGEAAHADAATLGHANRVAGVLLNSPAVGDTARIRHEGLIDHVGWSFTPDEPVFLGLDGALVQSLGAGQFQQRVGYAVSATRLYVDIGEAVVYA